MALDFSNESYVRLYLRNTITWEELGWEGRCVFPLALREADRAGIINIGKKSPAEALTLLLRGPAEFIAVAVERMLDLEVMKHVGTELIFPRYIEANETGRSDVVRQRESRLKRRDKVISKKQQLDLPAQVQLSCDNSPSPEIINEKHGEEPCHKPLSKVKESKAEDTREEQQPCQVVNLKQAAKSAKQAAAEVGRNWLDSWHVKGGRRAASMAANKDVYVEIGRKPLRERELVAKHMSETEWILEDPRRAKPRHILNFWDEFVEGPRNFQNSRNTPLIKPGVSGPNPYKPLDTTRFAVPHSAVGAAE